MKRTQRGARHDIRHRQNTQNAYTGQSRGSTVLNRGDHSVLPFCREQHQVFTFERGSAIAVTIEQRAKTALASSVEHIFKAGRIQCRGGPSNENKYAK